MEHYIKRLEAFRQYIGSEGAGLMAVDRATALVTRAARYSSSTFLLGLPGGRLSNRQCGW
jgi:hypothetical protein